MSAGKGGESTEEGERRQGAGGVGAVGGGGCLGIPAFCNWMIRSKFSIIKK